MAGASSGGCTHRNNQDKKMKKHNFFPRENMDSSPMNPKKLNYSEVIKQKSRRKSPALYLKTKPTII